MRWKGALVRRAETGVLVVQLEERDHLEDLGVGGKIKLRDRQCYVGAFA